MFYRLCATMAQSMIAYLREVYVARLTYRACEASRAGRVNNIDSHAFFVSIIQLHTMGFVLKQIEKYSDNRVSFYETPKRILNGIEQDFMADFEDHANGTPGSRDEKYAESNPKKKDVLYHIIADEQINKRSNDSPMKYFMDGSRHVYKVGDILINGVVYPVVVGQIIIASCRRDNRKIFHYDINRQIVMSLPDAFSYDWRLGINFFKKKCEEVNLELKERHETKGGFLLQFDAFIPYDTSGDKELGRNKYLSRAISKVQNHMTDCERDKVKDICLEHVLNEDNAWLIKDGSLEYKRDMTNRTDDTLNKALHDNNMRYVLGVSKGFNPELLIEIEPKIGKIIAELPNRARTNAYVYNHEGHKYCVWYLRLRDTINKSNQFSDIIKVEFILLGDEIPSTAKINQISAHLINEAYPVCYGKDSRWANHIYPIYLTESYAKSKYINDSLIINQI